MKNNHTLKRIILLSTVFLLSVYSAPAQTYCSPAFVNGCALWNNHSISLNGINWTLGATSCTVWNYTNDTAYLNTGTAYPMTVNNGDWCGCGVWIDFNMNNAFDTIENLFHSYIALQTNTYNFSITIPMSVPTGNYRMRVIAGWGTDCYTVSGNGYGPCGSYQYGNFDDFTVHVNSTVGIAGTISEMKAFEIFPNPAGEYFSLLIPESEWKENTGCRIYDIAGKEIFKSRIVNPVSTMDISALHSGMYVIEVNGVKKKLIKV